MRADVVDDLVTRHIPPDAYPEAWDVASLKQEVAAKLNLDAPVDEWAKEEGIGDEEMAERLLKAADAAYGERVARNTPEAMRYVEKQVILQSLDHLVARTSCHARSFAPGHRLARHGAARPAQRI